MEKEASSFGDDEATPAQQPEIELRDESEFDISDTEWSSLRRVRMIDRMVLRLKRRG